MVDNSNIFNNILNSSNVGQEKIGGAEGEDRGQMGSTRMEEQTMTAELAAVKIKKEHAISKRRKGRGGDGMEMREGRNGRKREEEFRDKKKEERKYSKKGANRKVGLVKSFNYTLAFMVSCHLFQTSTKT